MNKKMGITVTMMAVTVVILIILTGTIAFSIRSTVDYSTLSAWANEIKYIQDVVDEELGKDSTMNFTTGDILIDISLLTAEEKLEQFEDETITDNNVSLKIIDLNKLKIYNTKYGNLTSDTDVYAVSNVTGRVYYVQGIVAKDKNYYGLTQELLAGFSLTTSNASLSSVVFVPSVIGYTNKPITVTLKIPSTYTDIQITTSNNDIVVGEQQIKEKTYEYIVNTNLIAINYTINVTYNNGANILTSTYKVNGYDITAPVINEITDANYIYKQTETDEANYLINISATDESGIKMLKYEIGRIEDNDAKEYFKTHGKQIIDGKINLERNMSEYTIYAEDNAGNFAVKLVEHNLTAYAIYSETDNSLTFVKTQKKLQKGGIYNGKEITELYTGFETENYVDVVDVPWYNYRTNIISVMVEDKISPVSTEKWFQDLNNCTVLNLEKLDMSKATNMSYMFYGCGNSNTVTDFKIIGMDNWDVSQVTTMNVAFREIGKYATNWSIGDLSKWNTSNVTIMFEMFQGAGEYAEKWSVGNLDNWDTSNVKNMYRMFYQAGRLSTSWNVGDISGWKTYQVTNMSEMFRTIAANVTGETVFSLGNISKWDTSQVINMSRMFDGTAMQANWFLDLSAWTVDLVTSYDEFNTGVTTKVIAPNFK